MKKLVQQFRIILFCGIFLVAGCDRIEKIFRPYVATVNGSKIYLDEYQARLAKKMSMLPRDFPSSQPNYKMRIEEEVLDNIITEKIMYLRAEELGVTVSSRELEEKINEIKKDYGDGFPNLFARDNLSYEQWKEEIRKELLLEKLVVVDVNAHITVSEDEAVDYFNEYEDTYKSEAKVRVAQIVVRDPVTAQRALERLQSGEDFSRVAREVSIGPETRRGGDLGFVTRQVMPEPLDQTIFSLQLNQISPIVKSPYGFHIFKVLEIKPARTRSFKESREEVMADIRTKKEEAAFLNWLEALKAKTVVKKEYAVLRNKLHQ